jgi:hypothetical protein
MKQLVIKSVLELLALILALAFIENYDNQDSAIAAIGLFIVLVLRFRFYPFIFKRKE